VVKELKAAFHPQDQQVPKEHKVDKDFSELKGL
jgi:hypothetical protein